VVNKEGKVVVKDGRTDVGKGASVISSWISAAK